VVLYEVATKKIHLYLQLV